MSPAKTNPVSRAPEKFGAGEKKTLTEISSYSITSDSGLQLNSTLQGSTSSEGISGKKKNTRGKGVLAVFFLQEQWRGFGRGHTRQNGEQGRKRHERGNFE